MDGWRDNWTDIRMNGRAEGHSVCQMDERTTRRIDRPTDGEKYAEIIGFWSEPVDQTKERWKAKQTEETHANPHFPPFPVSTHTTASHTHSLFPSLPNSLTFSKTTFSLYLAFVEGRPCSCSNITYHRTGGRNGKQKKRKNEIFVAWANRISLELATR